MPVKPLHRVVPEGRNNGKSQRKIDEQQSNEKESACWVFNKFYVGVMAHWQPHSRSHGLDRCLLQTRCNPNGTLLGAHNGLALHWVQEPVIFAPYEYMITGLPTNAEISQWKGVPLEVCCRMCCNVPAPSGTSARGKPQVPQAFLEDCADSCYSGALV